jgi:hypothetical protein
MGIKINLFTIQSHPKYTQIGIFGLKTNHLATLIQGGVQTTYFNGLAKIIRQIASKN